MFDWRRSSQLLGETVREMGVLITVFVPPEAIFTEIVLSKLLLAAISGFGLFLIAGGIMLETRR
jgi:hypothetical protein